MERHEDFELKCLLKLLARFSADDRNQPFPNLPWDFFTQMDTDTAALPAP
jgi:hypothetical protein